MFIQERAKELAAVHSEMYVSSSQFYYQELACHNYTLNTFRTSKWLLSCDLIPWLMYFHLKQEVKVKA